VLYVILQRAFRISSFSRWAGKCGLSDEVLSQAVQEMKDGLIDAQSGGGLVKKRIAVGSFGEARRRTRDPGDELWRALVLSLWF